MSRGEITVKGTPNFIKDNFGIGYELIMIADLNEIENDKMKQDVKRISQDMQVDKEYISGGKSKILI